MLNYLVYIGRFQPFHVGHERVIKYALTQAEKVIILIGSTNVHKSLKNPWTFDERRVWINQVFAGMTNRIIIRPIKDIGNDTAWIAQVQSIVTSAIHDDQLSGWNDGIVGIIGHDKDSSTYYLNLFPAWNRNRLDLPASFGTINATDLREEYFQKSPHISEFIPDKVRTYLREFAMRSEFKWYLREADVMRQYKHMWRNSPYPPVFITTDAVVEQSGNILLIKRKDPPFAGALALPGGYLNVHEKIRDCVIRELKEETKISDKKGEIPPAMLESFIEGWGIFDTPDRDPRGRLVTHAFHFKLPANNGRLYKVKGSDDAEHAQWYRLGDLRAEDFALDHAKIIEYFLDVKWS